MLKENLNKSLLLIVGALLGTIVSMTTTMVFAHGGDATKVHSCVMNTLLTVRIVGASTNCLGTETAVDWDQDAEAVAEAVVAENKLPLVCRDCDLSPMANKFKGKDLSYSLLNNPTLQDVDMSGTNFSHARILYINATDSDFSDTNFTSSLTVGNFTRADLTDADFSSAEASFNFTDANLQNANFTNVSFVGSDLTGATNMDTANLTGVTWGYSEEYPTICPDGTNSWEHSNTCIGHLTP